ncbi:MAG: hypothetical protein J2P46_09635 [Zavarzinella sp.]|nr:hypothetical protein [Zavarzinella sp.]
MSRHLSALVRGGLVLALACAGGCVLSDVPLSDPAPSEADKALYGRWRAETNDGPRTLEFAPPTADTPKARGLGDERVMVLTSQAHLNGQAWGSTARAFVTEVNGTTFLNLYEEHPGAYGFLRYRLDGDTLDVWQIDTNAMAEGLRRGELFHGEVTYDRGSVTEVRIRRGLRDDGPSRDKLRAFLTGKHAAAVFPDVNRVRYTRVKDKK